MNYACFVRKTVFACFTKADGAHSSVKYCRHRLCYLNDKTINYQFLTQNYLNTLYFLFGRTLKKCIVFFDTHGIYIYIYIQCVPIKRKPGLSVIFPKRGNNSWLMIYIILKFNSSSFFWRLLWHVRVTHRWARRIWIINVKIALHRISD